MLSNISIDVKKYCVYIQKLELKLTLLKVASSHIHNYPFMA